MSTTVAANLAKNLRQLRSARGLTQARLARAAQIPRPTLANLESGVANPTLAVLVRIAGAFQVSVESLISPPRSTTQFYPASSFGVRRKGDAGVRPVLPDRFGALEIDRMELPSQGRMAGMPHKEGTREYLTCETGELELTVAGESWRLAAGDAVVFRGDQRHSYYNPGRGSAVGYSVILLGPGVM